MLTKDEAQGRSITVAPRCDKSSRGQPHRFPVSEIGLEQKSLLTEPILAGGFICFSEVIAPRSFWVDEVELYGRSNSYIQAR
jgi:hypothetical protein